MSTTDISMDKDTHKVLRSRHQRFTCECALMLSLTHTYTQACTQPHTYSHRWSVLPPLSTCSGG